MILLGLTQVVLLTPTLGPDIWDKLGNKEMLDLLSPLVNNQAKANPKHVVYPLGQYEGYLCGGYM